MICGQKCVCQKGEATVGNNSPKPKKKTKVRPLDWNDVGPGGGARRILDTAKALKGATPKPPKKKK